jgi:hypothetical protein
MLLSNAQQRAALSQATVDSVTLSMRSIRRKISCGVFAGREVNSGWWKLAATGPGCCTVSEHSDLAMTTLTAHVREVDGQVLAGMQHYRLRYMTGSAGTDDVMARWQYQPVAITILPVAHNHGRDDAAMLASRHFHRCEHGDCWASARSCEPGHYARRPGLAASAECHKQHRQRAGSRDVPHEHRA